MPQHYNDPGKSICRICGHGPSSIYPMRLQGNRGSWKYSCRRAGRNQKRHESGIKPRFLRKTYSFSCCRALIGHADVHFLHWCAKWASTFCIMYGKWHFYMSLKDELTEYGTIYTDWFTLTRVTTGGLSVPLRIAPCPTHRKTAASSSGRLLTYS